LSGLALTALYIVTHILHLHMTSALILAFAGVGLIMFFIFLISEFVESDASRGAAATGGTKTSGPNKH
jgi:ABC-type maltose transport system permease subunit